MKKILHIQVLPKLSGVQKISLEILKKLPIDEYDKYVLFSNSIDCGDKEDCVKCFTEAGVTVLFLSSLKREIGWSDIKVVYDIYKLCKKEHFDIVHTNSTKPGVVGRIAATLAGVPLIIHTVHGLSFNNFVRFPKWQIYWLCEIISSFFCDKIVLVNEYYMRYFKIFQKKTLTIYNGIDFQILDFEREKSFEKKILFVGRLDYPKDPITLLKAAFIVCQKYPDVTFTIVGDGELYNECLTFIDTHHLGDNIKLEGWQSNVSSYYRSHDIFVMSSLYESFGLVFLEAGYYKLPVVATNVEGIPEVVKDGVTGFLCDAKDEKKIANNIIRLIEDESLRKTMGEIAHKRVVDLFRVEKMVHAYMQLYRNL